MLLLHVVLTILLLNRTIGEQVDVVEAISSASNSDSNNNDLQQSSNESPGDVVQQRTEAAERGNNNNANGNNDAANVNKAGAAGGTDQVALESGSDQESSGSHSYPQNLRIVSSSHGHQKPFPPPVPHHHHHPHHHHSNVQQSYHGPPPPLPLPPQQSPTANLQNHQKPGVSGQSETLDKLYNVGSVGGGGGGAGVAIAAPGAETWPIAVNDMPKIVNLDVKCDKNSMKVFIGFDKPFYGIVFSKGHYSNLHCVHLPAGLGRSSATFEVSVHACGTSGNTENGLYGYGSDSGSGSYFENTVVIQYDPQVQEVWDQARKLRCTWHDQYEKSVTFRPFPVDMLDVIRADFAGDNVGCWMQIQVGKGPWASEVSGLVKIGQTMTMVLAIKDDDSKFDMLVRNCMAHDGKRAPIQLVDQRGCVTRSKLMSRFTKIKNFGASASVLSYAHFQAFKFPDSMEVHFQCTIQICRYQCPEQCTNDPIALLQPHHENILAAHHGTVVRPDTSYGGGGGPAPLTLEAYLRGGGGPNARRDERRVKKPKKRDTGTTTDPEQEVGVNRVIKVVSSGDLTFSLEDANGSNSSGVSQTMIFPIDGDNSSGTSSSMICMTSLGFSATLVFLLTVLFISCLLSSVLCIRLRTPSTSNKVALSLSSVSEQRRNNISATNIKKLPKSCFYS